MAGGTWSSQNKVRPGVYIRFKSTGGLGLTVGERGTVAICEPLSWGPVAQVMEIESGADMTPYTGYDITNAKNCFLKEIFKGSNRTAAPTKVLLFPPRGKRLRQGLCHCWPAYGYRKVSRRPRQRHFRRYHRADGSRRYLHRLHRH